jgi:hypothetical protein
LLFVARPSNGTSSKSARGSEGAGNSTNGFNSAGNPANGSNGTGGLDSPTSSKDNGGKKKK